MALDRGRGRASDAVCVTLYFLFHVFFLFRVLLLCLPFSYLSLPLFSFSFSSSRSRSVSPFLTQHTAQGPRGPVVTMARASEQNATPTQADPWKPLDPHEAEGTGEVHAPFKRLATYRVRWRTRGRGVQSSACSLASQLCLSFALFLLLFFALLIISLASRPISLIFHLAFSLCSSPCRSCSCGLCCCLFSLLLSSLSLLSALSLAPCTSFPPPPAPRDHTLLLAPSFPCGRYPQDWHGSARQKPRAQLPSPRRRHSRWPSSSRLWR